MIRARIAALILLLIACTAGTASAQVVQSQGPNFGTFSIGQVEIPLGATGGVAPYTWSVQSGSLPPGLLIRPDKAGWFPVSASAGISGIATAPGTYTFTLRVTDSTGGTPLFADQACTIKISPVAIKDSFQIPDGFVGAAYSYTLTPLNNTGAVTWAIVGGSLSGSGLTLSSGGVISGTPTTAITYPLQVSATDAGTGDTVSRGINLRINPVNITTDGVLPNAVQGSAYGPVALVASGGSGTGYTFTAGGGMPPGLSMNASGVISGSISTTAFASVYGFNVTVKDSLNNTYTKNMSIDLVGVPSFLPYIRVYGNLEDCTYGVSCNRSFGVSNGGKAPFVWSASGLPAGMSIRSGFGLGNTFTTAGDAEIWGTPTQLGNFQVTITVTDANGMVTSDTYPLHVSRLLQTDYPPSGTLNTPYNGGSPVKLRVIGGTLPYTFTPISGHLPAGLTFDPTTFLLGGTPVESGNSPSFSVYFQLTDSSGSPDTMRNTNYLNVFGPKTLNITNSFFLGTASTGSNFSFQLGSCCAASTNWTLLSGTLPTGMTLTLSGLVTGVPTVPGAYTFTAKATDASDATNFAQREFQIIVTPIQLTSNANLPNGSVGSSYSTTLTFTGATGAVTWAVLPGTYLPPGMSIVGNTLTSSGNNLLQSGQYNFTLVGIDTVGNVISRTFTFYVWNGPPPINLAINGTSGDVTFNASTFGQVSFGLSGFGGTPPYHFSITAGAVPGLRTLDGPPLPINFNFPAAYAGIATTPGTYVTTIRVTDSLGAFLERHATIIVSPVHVTSQFVLPRAAIGVPYGPVTLTSWPPARFETLSSGIPQQTNGWALTSGSLPPGLSLSPSGVISGTVTAGANPNYSPQVSGGTSRSWTDANMDLTPDCNFANFSANGECGAVTNPIRVGESINVDPFAITTSGVLPSGVFGTPYPPTTLTASNCGTGCTWSGLSLSGLTLNPTTGQITGTPTATNSGTFTITAAGSNGVVQKTFSLLVTPAGTPGVLNISTGATQGYTTLGSSVAVQLTAGGGQPPYSWSVTAGTLPPGVTLQGPGRSPGCLVFDTASATCTTPMPALAADAQIGQNQVPGATYLAGRIMGLGVSGAYDFTLSVTDNLGTTVSKDIHWLVSPIGIAGGYSSLPIAGGASLVHNHVYNQPLLALGGSGVYTWTATTPMPPGLTLDSSTGVVSGTPTNTGGFNTSVQISDDAGNTFVFNLGFNIAAGPPATTTINLSPALTQTFQRGVNFSVDLRPFGGTGPYTITALTALPPGVSLLTGSALMSDGTPGVNYYLAGALLADGPFVFTLHVQDSGGSNYGERTFTFNTAPFVIATNSLPDGSAGVAYSQQLIAWNNGGPVTWSLSPASPNQLPAGLTLSAGGLLAGTPTPGPAIAGTYSITVNATVGGVTISRFYPLRISNLTITDSPVLPNGTSGTAYNHTFTAAGGGGPLTWSASGLPPNLTLSTSGVLSGTLAGNISALQTFVVTVTDGGVPFSKRFGFTVRPYNPGTFLFSQPVVALPDTVVGANFSFTLSTIGGTPPYTWTVAPGSTLPPGLNIVSGASLPQGVNPVVTQLAGAATTVGAYTFDLIATDTLSAQVRQTFHLNVSPVTIVAGNPRNGTVGVAYSQRFTPVGGTGPYTFTMTPANANTDMLPPGWTITSDGLVSGTPTETGFYNFILHAQDSGGNTFSRTYSFTIANAFGLFVQNSNPPDAWVGSGQSSDSLRAGTLNGSVSTYTWSLAPGSGPLPPGMSLVDATPFGDPGSTYLGGQPTTPGTYVFKVRATDNANPASFADHTLTFRVAPMQLVQPLLLLTQDLAVAHVGVPYSYVFRVTGGTGPYTFTESPLAPLPPGFSLSANGVLSGIGQTTSASGIALLITDAAGYTLATPTMALGIAPPGTNWPLFATNEHNFPDASVGQFYDIPLSGKTADELHFPLTRFGSLPLTWSVASGTLPPGLSIVDAHLTGTPTAAGDYSFVLLATDQTGHSALVPGNSQGLMTLSVKTLTVGPAGLFLPRGVVGAPYSSISLAASGGSAPYQYLIMPFSDLPPGLAVNPATGLLSGTPTSPGTFVLVVQVTDNVGAVIDRILLITIDKPPHELRNTDFDNDGKRDMAVYRPSTGGWYYLSSQSGSATPVLAGTLGSGSDRLVDGDYDGDGEADRAVFHPTGQWEVQLSTGGTITRSFGLNTDIPVPGDYDGDGKTDFAIYRPSEGKWYYLSSFTGSLTPIAIVFGTNGDIPVPGDYDGDGKTDAAVYHAATGQWSLLYSHNGLTDVIMLGSSADRPVPRDYDGDGKTDVAIFHPTGLWSIRYSSTGVTQDIAFGLGTDVAVPADYNGDGLDDLAIYRPSNNTFYIYVPTAPLNPLAFVLGQRGDRPIVGSLPFTTTNDHMRSRDGDGDHKADPVVYRPSTGTWSMRGSTGNFASVTTRSFGGPTDIPVPGDYDGDGKTDLGVYHRLGQWEILLSSTNYTTTTGANWGLRTDIPVPGDYDGDGRTDFAVFRPSEGKWYILSANLTTTLTFTLGAAGDTPVSGDFDGDGLADPAVYRHSTGQWIILLSSSNYTTTQQISFGDVTDIPAPGDFDGDGKTDLVVFTRTGLWKVALSSGNYLTSQEAGWGLGSDVPVPGDYDGDGRADYAVFRPSEGNWYIEFSSSNYTTSQTLALGSGTDRMVPAPNFAGSPAKTDLTRTGDYDGDGRRDVGVYTPAGNWVVKLSSTDYSTTATLPPFGLSTDHPVPGDYDGDGRTDLAIFRPSDTTWYISLSGTNFATTLSRVWGLASDVPVPADYDGDGRTDIAVYRPSDNTWRILFAASNFTTNTTIPFGVSGDVPVPGDYDGDGKTDLAVYRPSEGKWYIVTAASGYASGFSVVLGVAGDIPVPADYDGDGKTDVAVFHNNGQWEAWLSGTNFTTNLIRPFGLSTDLPAAADYDGDGQVDFAIYRPSESTWYILLSTTGYTNFISIAVGTPIVDSPLPHP